MKLQNVLCLLLLFVALSSTLFAQELPQGIAPGEERYLSPRVGALAKELAAGNRAALEKFWEEVSKQGTPLVEPVAQSEKYRWVTFLWRGKQNLRWVSLLCDMTESVEELKAMLRLRDTDVWYRTLKLRTDTRMAYAFAVDPGEQIPSNVTVVAEPGSFPTDPFTPRRSSPSNLFGSLCELSDAPPQPWITRQPDVPVGQVKWQSFKSEKLKNERQIGVYTPPDYRANGQPYGLLFVFDGRAYTSLIPTPVILDNLLAKKLLPPVVAVFIGHTKPDRRDEELACNAEFTDFLAQELVPWVRQRYRVTTKPQQTIIAGSSLGGLAASFAALRHPNIFGNVLSQSGSYDWSPEFAKREADEESEWLIKQFVAKEKLPVRFYLEAGLLEGSLLAANRHLRDVLQAKSYEVQYREFYGGHDYFNWRGTFADGLLALLGKAKKPQ